jgi:hypothetical protein
MDRMLTKLKQLGGARTTNAPPQAPFLLPLADWTCYSHDEFLTHPTGPLSSLGIPFERRVM